MFKMLFFSLILSLCVISGNCLDFSELQHPSFIGETYFNQDEDVDGIVGGSEASIEDHPHQVGLYMNDKFWCGGFIISENYILTAAHCGKLFQGKTVVARAGSSYYNGSELPIKKVVVHPEYNPDAFDKDVAVMKTVNPIEFNDVIKSIQLPKKGRNMEEGTDVVVSGWGLLKGVTGNRPDQLMAVQIPVVDRAQCQKGYTGINYVELTENMFCAGNYDLGGKGACNGDSGGPVTQEGMAVGVVSFGPLLCAEPGRMSVFANIAAPAVRDFITKETGL